MIGKTLRVIAVLLGLALAAASGTTGTSGSRCRKGCPCGNACIDCSDTCHK